MEILNTDISTIKNLAIQEKSVQNIFSMFKVAKGIARYMDEKEKQMQYSLEIVGFRKNEPLPQYRKKNDLREPIHFYARPFSRKMEKTKEDESGKERFEMAELDNLILLNGELKTLKTLFETFWLGLENDILEFVENIIKNLGEENKASMPEIPKELLGLLKEM